MSKQIRLSGKRGAGKCVLVDDDIYTKYGHLKWHISAERYACRKNKVEGNVFLHRLIMNAPAGMVVDHLNHNTLDCRRSNLRVCTQAENCKNVKVSKGYYFDRWIGLFNVQYRGKYFGRYKTEQEARRAYRLACSGLTMPEVKAKIRREFSV